MFFSEPFAPTGVAVFSHTAPHFLLLTQAQSDYSSSAQRGVPQGGLWRFVLEEIGSDYRIEVSETEPGVWGERLQLLAVVRGLEALEQPSRVTLITPSRFVGNGIRANLAQWRDNEWQWESFGEMTEIKNVDLWKRIDQALHFHRLDCRVWDFDSLGSSATRSEPARATEPGQHSQPLAHTPARRPADEGRAVRNNRITFDQLQQQRDAKQIQQARLKDSYRIKPLGRGRAFGLYDPSALSTVSFTG